MSYFSDMSAVFGGTANSDQQQGAAGGTLGLAGIGMTAYGAITGANAQKQEASTSIQEAQADEQINAQRQQMMVLDANRKMTQVNRNTQMARAQSQAASVASGSQFGSGEAGGQASITAQGAYNSAGINQDLQIGKNIFSLDNSIDQLKIQQAQEQSKAATGQGWMQLGMSVASTAGKFAAMGA